MPLPTSSIDLGLPLRKSEVKDEATARELNELAEALRNLHISLTANEGGYFNPKVWVSGADISLEVGQSLKASFAAATSMLLHVACATDQIYEMYMAGTYTAAAAAAPSILQPNNATPATNLFTIRQLYSAGASAAGTHTAGIADGGFRLEVGGASLFLGKSTVFTATATKRTLSDSSSTTTVTSYKSQVSSDWQDTTTLWTSLGTLIFPNAWTGTVVVKRIL